MPFDGGGAEGVAATMIGKAIDGKFDTIESDGAGWVARQAARGYNDTQLKNGAKDPQAKSYRIVPNIGACDYCYDAARVCGEGYWHGNTAAKGGAAFHNNCRCRVEIMYQPWDVKKYKDLLSARQQLELSERLKTAPIFKPTKDDFDVAWDGRTNARGKRLGGHRPGNGWEGKNEPPPSVTREQFENAVLLTIEKPQNVGEIGTTAVRLREIDGIIWRVDSYPGPNGHQFNHGYPWNGNGVIRNTASGPVARPLNREALLPGYVQRIANRQVN